MNSIEKEIIDNYIKNMEFLKKVDIDLHTLVSSLSSALESGQIEENYSLEYKDDSYFDIYNIRDNSYIYDMDSNIFRSKIVDIIDLDPKKNIFDTLDIENLDMLGKRYHTEDIFNYIKQNKSENKEYRYIPKFIFLGTLLGSHIPDILNKLFVKQCFIYEPNLEIFRLSLFVAQYYKIDSGVKFHFSIMRDESEFEQDMKTFLDDNSNLNYAIKFYATPQHTHLVKNINMLLSTDQPTLMDFRKRLLTYKNSIDKLIYKNNILDFSKLRDSLNKKDIILVAAGPSLEKNIEWLKDNQDRYMIFAVGAVLRHLYRNGIKPSVIVEAHFNNEIIESYDDIDPEFYKDSLILAADQTPKEALELFEKDRLFIYPSINFIYTNLMQIDGDNVGNIALYMICLMNPRKLYLLGIDMAVDDSGATHVSSHIQKELTSDNRYSNKDTNIVTQETLFKVKGNLKDEVLTTPTYYLHYLVTQKVIDNFSDIDIYNLSNGIYFKNTKPLLTKDIKINDSVKSEQFLSQFENNLIDASVCGLSKNDDILFKNLINELDLIIDKKDVDINLVIPTLNAILTNTNINSQYRQLVYNYSVIITPYIDKFLNNKTFNKIQRDKHKTILYKLFYRYLIELTKEFRDNISRLYIG